MTRFSKIKTELQKITHLDHVQTLKKELKRLTIEIRKRGETEVAVIERNVRRVRTRIQKLQKQIETELLRIRKQVAAMRSPTSKRQTSKRRAARGRSAAGKTARAAAGVKVKRAPRKPSTASARKRPVKST